MTFCRHKRLFKSDAGICFFKFKIMWIFIYRPKRFVYLQINIIHIYMEQSIVVNIFYQSGINQCYICFLFLFSDSEHMINVGPFGTKFSNDHVTNCQIILFKRCWNDSFSILTRLFFIFKFRFWSDLLARAIWYMFFRVINTPYLKTDMPKHTPFSTSYAYRFTVKVLVEL